MEKIVTVIVEQYRQLAIKQPGQWVESRRYATQATERAGKLIVKINGMNVRFGPDGRAKHVPQSRVRYRLDMPQQEGE